MKTEIRSTLKENKKETENNNNKIKMDKSSGESKQNAETLSKQQSEQTKKKSETPKTFEDADDYPSDFDDDAPSFRLMSSSDDQHYDRYGTGRETSPERHIDDIRSLEVQRPAQPAPAPPDALDN
jgi:hypothetical protein